jgi:REP element-mobilizing transposase RayT
MSRLRRLLLNRRIFFVTTHFAKAALPLSGSECDALLRAVDETRARRRATLFAYVVMPTHCHLLLAAADDDRLSALMRELKLRAAKRILRARGNAGPLWQARYFDRIMRSRKEWSETVDYIHGNPVKDGLVRRAEDWPWSSWRGWQRGGRPPIPVDHADLPLSESARLDW